MNIYDPLKIEERKKLIKEFLKCYVTGKKRPDYEEKLDRIRFVGCKITSSSEPSDFIRIQEHLITKKNRIDYIKITKKGDYLLYFKGARFPIRTSDRYVRHIKDIIGCPVVNG